MANVDLSDFARAAVEYFVERRGKGTTISSADQHLLFDWEMDDVPLHVVLAGVDRAFTRKTDAPKSLKECKRYVTWARKKWAGGELPDADDYQAAADDLTAPDEAAEPPSPAAEPPPPGSLAARAVAVLTRSGEAGPPPLTMACTELVAEIESIAAQEGDLDAAMVAALDDALVELVLEQLDDEVRGSVLGAAEGELRARHSLRSMSDEAVAARRAAVRRQELGRRIALPELVSALAE